MRKGLLSWGALDDALIVNQLPEGPVTNVTAFLDEDIRFEPRRSEAVIIGRIERAARDMCDGLFADSDRALERFYASVRIPEYTPTGTVKTTSDGEIVWMKDELGEYREDWSKLDGMDVEAAVGTLQRVVSKASDQVARLQARALFAREVSEDEYYDHYGRQVQGGTIEERRAAARRASRDSRFHFIVQWWVHHLAAERLRILEQTLRDLQFQRSRYIKSVESSRWS